MLVLTRKAGDEIVLEFKGETIKLVILDVKGKQARIGTEAGKDVFICRGEAYDKNSFQKRRPKQIED